MIDPNAILQQAFAQHQAGALQAACELYRQVLTARPAEPDALHLLGVAHATLGDPAEGIALIRRAIAAKPVFPPAHFNLGSLLHGQGQSEAALASLATCIAQAPNHPGALAASGRAMLALGREQDAVASFMRALQTAPEPITWNDLGVALQRCGRTDEAVRAYAEATHLRPSYAEAHYNRGCLLLAGPDLDAAAGCFEATLSTQPAHRQALWNLTLVRMAQNRPDNALAALDRLLLLEPSHLAGRRQRAALLSAVGRPVDAIVELTAVLDARPNDVDALTGRAGLLRTLGGLDEAVGDLNRALSVAPDHVEALIEWANVAHDRCDHDAALAAYDQALGRRPDDLAALVNRGATLHAMGRPAEALETWRQALSVQPDQPDVVFNIGLCLLRMGDWQGGWQAHEARLRQSPWRDVLPGYVAPQWDGRADLTGRRLLLVGEQGLGDTMQFTRFARLVAARGATVILGVDPRLRRLMASLDGVTEVVGPDDPDPAYDLFCPLMSLPARLGLTLPDASMPEPYLRADPADIVRWRVRLAGLPGRKVGLVWAGDPRTGTLSLTQMDHRRSMTLDQLAPVLAVPNVTFVSVQKGAASAQAAGRNIEDWTAELDDFADTAALIQALDLLITVDTSAAHAAGALGRPVWVLNRFDRCWRWMMDRTDTPWYPTMRLFTQTRFGVWDDVVAEVAAALAASG
jgi:tetratricopeptide (TPR) repeat protein